MSSQDSTPNKISHTLVVYITVGAVGMFISTIAVILRFVSRVLTLSVKWDDWASLAALVFAYACLITVILDATIGHGGYDVHLYSIATLNKLARITSATNITYIVSVSLSRISMLLFYLRIFQIRKPFRIASYFVGFLTVAFLLIGIFGLIFAFSPVAAQWNYQIPSTTIDLMVFYMFLGVMDIVLDLFVLFLPQPIVWKLKMSSKQRLLLSGVFCTGAFVCAAGIVRVVYISKINLHAGSNSKIDHWHDVGIWQAIELNMSIICSCLATYPSLIRHYRKRSRSRSGTRTQGTDRTKKLSSNDDSGFGGSAAYLKVSEPEQRSMDRAHHDLGYAMSDMGSVRVQTDIRVRWDGESHNSSEIV